MAAETIGTRFLASALATEALPVFIKHGDIEHLFRGVEGGFYRLIVSHVKRYGVLPRVETITAEGESALYFQPPPEPPQYYLDQLYRRYTDTTLRSTLSTAVQALGQDNPDSPKVLSELLASLSQLSLTNSAQTITDFRKAYDYVIPEYVAKFRGDANSGIQLGWPTLDSKTGGLTGGDIVSYVGRPAMGKTFQLLFSALHMWEQQGLVPLFISMEMHPLVIMQRLASMTSHVSISHLMQGAMDSYETKTMRDRLRAMQGATRPFYIVDGNMTSTVDDIFLLGRQLKPDVVFIDGAYLLRHSDAYLNRYQRVAENCDLLKSTVASGLDVPVICSWQFAKTVMKLRAGESPGLEHIGYSDAIGQISSTVLGLFEEDSVETLVRRRVEILKGRSGEVGEFMIKWDFKNMDFSEVPPTEQQVLEYV